MCTSAVNTSLPTNILDAQISRNDVLDAEILWILHTVQCHNSYKSNEVVSTLFQKIFPDSSIAAKFSCGRSKTAYFAVFGIAPYLKDVLTNRFASLGNYVLLFDESLNEMQQTKQLDIHVRHWFKNRVKTAYLTSVFLGHATSSDLLDNIRAAILPLQMRKVLQVSMDGPNVNLKFLKLLQEQMKNDFDKNLIDLGTCGLHIHRAFEAGSLATNWKVEDFLSSLYRLFKDSPARREDFVKITEELDFPVKFVKHRWVENVLVCEKALKLLPNIRKYIEEIKRGHLPTPKCLAFSVVRQNMDDKLLSIKLNVFLSIAKTLLPFLISFQSDQPMCFFLAGALEKILKTLLQRFVKPEDSENLTLQKILRMDVKDTNIHCKLENVALGFVAEKHLKSLYAAKKITERQVFNVRVETKQFLIQIVTRLCEKSPAAYSLVRCLSCLDPKKMASEKVSCKKKMKLMLALMVDVNQVSPHHCDDILVQYNNFIDSEVPKNLDLFSEYDPSKSRVDALFLDMMNNKNYCKLWDVVQKLLLLSHGQATVERGFSVNKQIEVENLKERSYISQRLICDFLSDVNLSDLVITKELRASVSAARKRYICHI